MLLRHPHAAPRNALQRKMAGGEPSSSERASRGPSVLRQSQEGRAGQRSPRDDWRRARWEGAAAPPSPSHRPVSAGAEPRAGPQGSRRRLRKAPAEGREGFNPCQSVPRSNVLATVHTPALRVTSLSRPRSPGLHTGLSSHLGRQRVARSSASAAEPGPEPSASGVTFSPHHRPACPRCPSPSPEPRTGTCFQKHLGHDTFPPRDPIPSVCSSQLLPQLRRPLPQTAP